MKDERGPAFEIARRLRGLERALQNTLYNPRISKEEETTLKARRGIYEGVADDIDRDYRFNSKGPELTNADVGMAGSKALDRVRCYDEHSAKRMLASAHRLTCRLCNKDSEFFIAVPNEYGFNVFPGYCAVHGAAMLTPLTTPVQESAPSSSNGQDAGRSTPEAQPVECFSCEKTSTSGTWIPEGEFICTECLNRDGRDTAEAQPAKPWPRCGYHRGNGLSCGKETGHDGQHWDGRGGNYQDAHWSAPRSASATTTEEDVERARSFFSNGHPQQRQLAEEFAYVRTGAPAPAMFLNPRDEARLDHLLKLEREVRQLRADRDGWKAIAERLSNAPALQERGAGSASREAFRDGWVGAFASFGGTGPRTFEEAWSTRCAGSEQGKDTRLPCPDQLAAWLREYATDSGSYSQLAAAALTKAAHVLGGEPGGSCPDCHEDCQGWIVDGSRCGRKG